MYQVPNQINKTQYLILIDKCTQIIREDRIWLRNMVKANNQDILYLLKTIPKNISTFKHKLDMKQLQIKLRKYIMRAKEKEKQEQLQKFKQNMHLSDFVEFAQEKKQLLSTHNKIPTKQTEPLRETQSNESKSSFAAKWNNYTHYNQSINLTEGSNCTSNCPPPSNFQCTSSKSKNLKREWSNCYKQNSFNRNLNTEFANTLYSKKKSFSNLATKKNKSTTSLPKDKKSIDNSRSKNNEQIQNLNQRNVFAGRSSSKSLKQLQSKIYQQLRLFQQNKTKREFQNNNMNKICSQRSVQKHFEKASQPFLQTAKVGNLTKQNIDQILKFKLGNYDYESYKKSIKQDDQQENLYREKQHSTSQRKLYHSGLFPPIEEQTERDSESQRYPEDPWKFGLNLKQENQDKQKTPFASFAKNSNQNSQSCDLADPKFPNLMIRNHVNQFQTEDKTKKSISSVTKETQPVNFANLNHQQYLPQKKGHGSLYQSAEKKSDAQENYIESDLHKSIVSSIQKGRSTISQQNFFHKNSNMSEMINQNKFDFGFQKDSQKPLPLSISKTSEISGFQPSHYSSTQDKEGLFTSPQLLNQCRNFLKKTQQINFENSGLKQFRLSIQKSNFDSPLNSQQKSFRQTFNSYAINNNTIPFPQPITITQSITKDYQNSEARINTLFQSKQYSVNTNNNVEFQTYSKPQFIGVSDSFNKTQFAESSTKKSQKFEFFQQQSAKKDEVTIKSHSRKNSSMKKHLEIQETLAQPFGQSNFPIYIASQNVSTQKQQIPAGPTVENFKTSQFNNISRQSSQKKNPVVQRSIWQLITLEDTIDRILEANQGNIEVNSTWLKHTVSNQHIFSEPISSVLKMILNQYTQSNKTHNFINVIQTIEAQFKMNPNYKPVDNPAMIIYSLLDIEQKGFITFEDMQNFVNQLQRAEVENIEEIAQNLQQVFEIADFTSSKEISYINLYVIKNEDCFENLWKYLKEFDFQITVEDQKSQSF